MPTRFAEARFTAQKPLQFRAGQARQLEITPTKPLYAARPVARLFAGRRRAGEGDRRESAGLRYAEQGNLVAVVPNGTACLGISSAARRPPVSMEGKGALFKRFADIDAIDLLGDTEEVEAFINSVRYLGPSFGGINLEDIKARTASSSRTG